MDPRTAFTVFIIAMLSAVWICSPAAAQKVAETRPAQRPADKKKPLADHCKDAVDPYVVSREKVRFFAAAGKDNELTAKEFTADQSAGSGTPFARKFDSFAAMLSFDKDGNGTIDWMEADAYRRDLRQRVLKAFDTDRDTRLRGDERVKANQALEAGKIPADKSKAKTSRPREEMGNVTIEMLQKYDANGDGVLDEEEIQAAMKEIQQNRRAERISRYDTDGDGKLSKEERDAIRWNRPKHMSKMLKQWTLKLCDEDGDGVLSDEEKLLMKDFGKQLQQISTNALNRMFDMDGDGQISKEERSIVHKELMVAGVRMMILHRSLVDTDGNGAVSPAEREGFEKRFAESLGTWMGGFSRTYDTDGNARFDTEERGNLVMGIQQEVDNRMTRHDTNKDGRTDPFEMEKMYLEFARDIGLFSRR